MRVPPGIRRAVRLPTTGERIARELDDEIRLHVEMRASALMAQGFSREQALAEALQRFGDVNDLRDYCVSIEESHMQRVQLRERIDGVVQDVHFALRQIRKAPGFAAIAAFTLALGVGATTAIFSVVSEVVLRPLPYPRAERIMQVWEVGASGRAIHVVDQNFNDLKKYNKSFSTMAAYQEGAVALAGNGEAVRALEAVVSAEFFDVLGAKPAAGRFFAADEQGGQGSAATTVVISYGFWQRQYAGSRSALGSTLKADSRTVTIVGVLPPDLEFPAGTDVFFPGVDLSNQSRTAHNLSVIARLKDGVTVDQAQRDVSAILRRLKAQFGDYMDAVDGTVLSEQDQIAGPIKQMLYLLLGASGILLLIACANVVNLLVARMAARENELAVRVAIGAGRARLVQQLLIESSVLALFGCAGGLLLAAAGVKALVALRPVGIPNIEHVGIDWRVLSFALAVSALTALALGLIAAWRGARDDLRTALSHGQRTQGGGGASDRVRGGLVVVQVAMTVVLLIGAGLLARSFVRLMSVDPGYRTHQVVVASLAYAADGPEETARRVQYYDDALARARAIPGVTAAGGAFGVPLANAGGDGTFLILNSINEKIAMSDLERLFQDKTRTGNADYRMASADYFKAMNIPLLRGRMFNDGDRPGAPEVAVISASLAKSRWPSEDPIGKVIEFGNMDGDLTPVTIVGVVGDVREQSLAASPRSVFYAYYRQRPGYARTFTIVMATTTPGPVMAESRRLIQELRTDLPVRISTIEEMISRSLAQQRFMLFLVGVFGAVALLLATLGVYSVISYLVAQRGHELSIRVALGARASDIVRLVLGQGITLALVGTVVGAGVAVAATRLLKRLLYEISPTDPIAFAGVVVLLAVVAVAASYLPARRASRASPMEVLRGG